MDFKEDNEIAGLILIAGLIAAACLAFGLYDAVVNHHQLWRMPWKP